MRQLRYHMLGLKIISSHQGKSHPPFKFMYTVDRVPLLWVVKYRVNTLKQAQLKNHIELSCNSYKLTIPLNIYNFSNRYVI